MDVGGVCEFSLVPRNGVGGCMRGGCRSVQECVSLALFPGMV